MKNFIVLAVAALFATNAVAAEMKWTGSTGWRYLQQSVSDNLDSKNNTTANKDVSTVKTRAHQIRANLGVMGGWENVEYGFGMRTGGAAAVNSDYVAVGGAASPDLGINIEQAWFRYVRDFGSLELAATIGRQKNAMLSDTAWQTLFDNDVRFDGFGWNFKFGMFGFNAAQYVMGAQTGPGATGAANYSYNAATDDAAGTKARFSMLWAFQPHMTWKFSDEIEAMFAVGYYNWNYQGQTNATGGVALPIANAGTVAPVAASTFNMSNRHHWDFLANISLPFNMTFTGDLVKSTSAKYNPASLGTGAAYTGAEVTVSNTAWTLGLTYGKLRKAQDFTVGYAYGTKGIGSVINAFTNDRFAADQKGHTVVAGYSLADNFHLGFRWINLSEKEKLSTTTGLAYAGTAAAQKNSHSYWELTAGVAF